MGRKENREPAQNLFERLDALIAEYEAIRQDIYSQYVLLTEAAYNGEIIEKEDLASVLYGMSDFYGDEGFLLLGERLAEYLYGVHPQIPRAMGYAPNPQYPLCGQAICGPNYGTDSIKGRKGD